LPDASGFPLTSDTSKTTQEKEGWATNATERALAGGAGSNRSKDDQWLRKVSLIVYSGSKDTGIELSALRVTFQLKKATSLTPNFLYAKIYNMNPETQHKVRQYEKVQLAAGYQTSNYGMIFDGTVELYAEGKENPTDTYLELWAGDATQSNNYSFQALTWPAKTLPSKMVKDDLKAMGLKTAEVELKGEKATVRSSSYVGLARDHIRDQTNAHRSDLIIDDGVAYVIPWEGYRKSEVVDLSPTTGLVSIPKTTPQGIEAVCLLNPKLRIGGLVNIDQKLISGILFQPGTGDTPYGKDPIQFTETGTQFTKGAATVNPTGTYKILVLDHFGDTRGNEWYSSIIGCATGPDGTPLPGSFSGTALTRSSQQVAG
jgi:hypothetical protein